MSGDSARFCRTDCGELGHRGEKARLVRGFRLQGHHPLPLDVVDRGIDPNRVTELRELARQDGFRIAEFCETPNRRRIEVRIGGDVQVAQDLIEAIG